MANLSSNSTTPEVDTIPEPGRILLITLGVLIATMGIPGNIMTIVAIVKCRPLRTRLNIFIVNLCITDVIAVGYVYPFVTFDFILGYHPVWLLWCQLNNLVLFMLTPTSFVTIMLITISRYIKIIHEDKFDKIFSRTNTIILCFMAWIPGFVLAAIAATNLPIISYVHFYHFCLGSGEFTKRKINSQFVISVFTLSYISSFYCYLRVWIWLRKHEQQLQRNDVFSKMKLDNNRKYASVSFLIVLLYICLTMPGIVIYGSQMSVSILFNSFSTLLYFLNSTVNCVVYGAMHTSIRRYYRRLLPSIWFNRVQPTSGT